MFLLEGDDLIDMSANAQAFMRDAPEAESDRQALVGRLERRFDHLGPTLDSLEVGAATEIVCDETGDRLRIHRSGQFIRLVLTTNGRPESPIDRLHVESLRSELDSLRTVAEASPQIIWKEGPDRTVTWANAAYLALVDSLAPAGLVPRWSPEPVIRTAPMAVDADAPVQERICLSQDDGRQERWFDVTSVRRGAETVHFAVDAGPVLAAQQSRRDMVQALAMTFAQLSTGLAVFDRARRLVMFNPALRGDDGPACGHAVLSPRSANRAGPDARHEHAAGTQELSQLADARDGPAGRGAGRPLSGKLDAAFGREPIG